MLSENISASSSFLDLFENMQQQQIALKQARNGSPNINVIKNIRKYRANPAK
jgi:hypothetical protein